MKQKNKLLVIAASATLVLLVASILILGNSDGQYKPEKKHVSLKMKFDE